MVSFLQRLVVRLVLLGGILPASLSAQVFDVSPTAATGDVQTGEGEAFYGTFGLDAANNSTTSYSVYRKLDGIDRVDTGSEIHTFTPLEDNPTAAIWEGIDHGGSGTQSGFHDPGMFIGNSPSPSTYADQLIYFSRNRNGTTIDDFDGGVGGDNLPNGTIEPDSNDRVNWEVSVGFLEDPDGFVDGRLPNSGEWDLWSSDWGTDGVQMRLFFTASDSEEIDNSDWFSFNETAGGDFPGAKRQSGDAVLPENQRDPVPTRRVRVGSGEEIAEFEGDFEAGGGDGFAVHIGVDYDDAMELSWKMELNDPGNADPVKAREVRFSAKTGNLEYISVFDPGASDNPVAPNEINDPDTPFTDGFFDWQNATPVFYLGLDNGTDYGEDGAWGIMGIFQPGDFNADGVVDGDDLAILNANLGQVDTTYSRGDIDQDGDTDADDLAAWNSLGGDLVSQIDAIKNLDERIAFVHNVAGTWMGDANLDGEFNSGDLVLVFTAGKYETGEMASWAEGDWDANMEFGSGDLVVAFTDGGYELGPRPAAAAVPEPTCVMLTWMLLVGCGSRLRRMTRRRR